MTVNPPRLVRVVLYVVTLIGTPLVAYLNARGVIGSLEVTFWSAEVTAVTGMAALNTSSAPDAATATVVAPADVEVRTKHPRP